MGWNHTQGQANARPKLEVAVRNISKKQGGKRKIDALLLWKSHKMPHKLGSRRTQKIPKQKNLCNKTQHKNGLKAMPSKCHDSNPDVHPTPHQRISPNDALTHLWRCPLPRRMGINSRINLQPCKQNPTKRQMGTLVPLLPRSTFGARENSPNGWHSLWNRKGTSCQHPSWPAR